MVDTTLTFELSESVVVGNMSSVAGEEPKIIRVVVRLVAIDVMGYLYASQRATEFHTEDDASERIDTAWVGETEIPTTAATTKEATIPATPGVILGTTPPEHRVLVATRSSTDLGSCLR